MIRYFDPDKWRSKRPAVAVGIPMTATLHRTAVNQFLSLMLRLREDDVFLPCIESAIASEARNTIINEFLNLPESVEYLFLFDDDMTIPIHTIEIMTWWKKPFVAGLCTQKQPPFLPTIYTDAHTIESDTYHKHSGDQIQLVQHIIDFPLDSGLREVDAVGAACLCLHRDLLKAIPAPWFKFEGGGEDIYFSRKVRAAGYKLLVDTHTHPGHIGQYTASYEDFVKLRDAGAT